MELRELKALVTLMRQNDLVELELEDGKSRIRLVRQAGSSAPTTHAGGKIGAVKPLEVQRASAPAVAANASPDAGSDEPHLAPNQVLVRSPMVGTFYRAPSPDAPPFVEEGDMVRKGQPLCIIEAMKMMNEITAEVEGRVVRILCQNAQPVGYGQPLMVLETG